MSMHEIEDYVEAGILAIACSNLSIADKRDYIYSLLEMEAYGDCSFTNLRTLKEQIACSFTFVFPKEEMYDYSENRKFYDEELPNRYAFGQGDLYFSWNNPSQICIDSGSEAWKEMVKIGKIQGEGARPVKRKGDMETLKLVKNLLGEVDEYLQQAHLGLFFFSDEQYGLSNEEFQELTGMTKEEADNIMSLD